MFGLFYIKKLFDTLIVFLNFFNVNLEKKYQQMTKKHSAFKDFKPKKNLILQYSTFYEQLKFHTQLS